MLFYLILLSLSTFCISSDPLGGPHAHIFNRVFDFFDKDGDNVVTMKEFWENLPKADSNDDGFITKDEFVEAWESITGHNDEEEEENKHSAELLFMKLTNTTLSVNDKDLVFNVFDTNKDGVVGREEFLMEWEMIHPEHDDYTHPPEPTQPTTP